MPRILARRNFSARFSKHRLSRTSLSGDSPRRTICEDNKPFRFMPPWSMALDEGVYRKGATRDRRAKEAVADPKSGEAGGSHRHLQEPSQGPGLSIARSRWGGGCRWPPDNRLRIVDACFRRLRSTLIDRHRSSADHPQISDAYADPPPFGAAIPSVTSGRSFFSRIPDSPPSLPRERRVSSVECRDPAPHADLRESSDFESQ